MYSGTLYGITNGFGNIDVKDNGILTNANNATLRMNGNIRVETADAANPATVVAHRPHPAVQRRHPANARPATTTRLPAGARSAKIAYRPWRIRVAAESERPATRPDAQTARDENDNL